MNSWALAFVFTQLVEAPLYLWGQRRDGPARAAWARLAIALGASAITHPWLWFYAPRAWVALYLAAVERAPSLRIASPAARFVAYALLFESLVVIVEALYLRAWGVRRAWRWSLLANAASVLLGLASRAAFGAP